MGPHGYPDDYRPETPWTGPYWDQQCPERNPGLTHVHWNMCPDGHDGDVCCDCAKVIRWRSSEKKAEMEAMEAQAVTVTPTQALHDFIFTVSGRCGKIGCGRVEKDHPQPLADPEPDECPVDHNSIKSNMLIGDGGQEWTKCPRCGVHVEPKHITGSGVQGPAWGAGRGVITDRLAKRLNFIAFRSSRPGYLP